MSPSTGRWRIRGRDGQGDGSFRRPGARRLRWTVPAGAVVVTAGGVLAASLVATAQATPTLPPRTPAQLLAAVAGRTGPPPPLTGTVVETASLGFPDLPGGSDPTSLQSLITGSHTIRVWFSDPQHIRLAIPGQLSETDVIRNGQDLWTWSSVHNTVTHMRLRPNTPDKAEPPMTQTPLTPQQAAQEVLAAVGPTTAVSVASNVTVAGEAAYELVLAPKDSRSLIGQVRIAIDAHSNVPLRVRVFPRGSSAPALQIGFTSIAFTRPAAANFNFKPPAGAKVVQNSVLPEQAPPLPLRVLRGKPGVSASVVVPAAGARAGKVIVKGGKPVFIKNGKQVVLPGRLFIVKNGKVVAVRGGMPLPVRAGVSAGVQLVPAVPMVARPTVIGKGWLAVAVNPAGGLGMGGLAAGNAGDLAGRELNALLGSASRVHGTWGNGRLLRTKLLSALLTDDGRLLIGAVTPDVLYSAAAQAGHANASSKASR